MKTKFKLTPHAHKTILEAARELPKLIKLNPDGSAQYRKLNTYQGATNFNVNGSYTNNTNKYAEPVMVNHEVKMRSAYYQFGDAGVKKYIQLVHEVNNKLMVKIKMKCEGCLKIHEVYHTPELADTTKSLTCNWCPSCLDNSTEDYCETEHENEIFGEPDPNQLNLL